MADDLIARLQQLVDAVWPLLDNADGYDKSWTRYALLLCDAPREHLQAEERARLLTREIKRELALLAEAQPEKDDEENRAEPVPEVSSSTANRLREVRGRDGLVPALQENPPTVEGNLLAGDVRSPSWRSLPVNAVPVSAIKDSPPVGMIAGPESPPVGVAGLPNTNAVEAPDAD